jgi:hypothetical protein
VRRAARGERRTANGEWMIRLYGDGFVAETKGRVPFKEDPDWGPISD